MSFEPDALDDADAGMPLPAAAEFEAADDGLLDVLDVASVAAPHPPRTNTAATKHSARASVLPECILTANPLTWVLGEFVKRILKSVNFYPTPAPSLRNGMPRALGTSPVALPLRSQVACRGTSGTSALFTP